MGALIGPSQVAARAMEMAVSRFHHPVWTKLASVVFLASGMGLLWMHFPFVAAALVLVGAGIGIQSIARGTLPLAVFGPNRYASVMGRIALPSLVMQAAAPLLGAYLIERMGADATLAVLFAAAIGNLALSILLFRLLDHSKAGHAAA